MGYTDVILRDSPHGFWPLDSQVSGSLPEAFGYSAAGTVVSGAINTKPVAAQSVGAQRISGTGITLPNNTIFINGMENRPFSLEWWIRPENVSGSGTIFKRTTSGVSWTAHTVSASVAFDQTITLSESGLKPGNNYHCVLTYDTTSISLYVNAELVDFATVTTDNLSAGFADTATSFSFGAASGFAYSLDSVAIYAQSISPAAIQRHYDAGTDYLDVNNLNVSRHTSRFIFSDVHASVNTSRVFDSTALWDTGFITGALAVDTDQLFSTWDDSLGSYGAGTWQFPIHVPAQATSLDGGRISWQANDDAGSFTVDITHDLGAHWTSVANDTDPIGTFAVTTGADFIVRVNVAADADQFVMERLSVVFYNSKSLTSSNTDVSATIMGGVMSELDYSPTSFADTNGLTLGGRVAINADAAQGGYKGIEFSVKPTSTEVSVTLLSGAGTPPTITTNGSGQLTFSNLTALYVDGAAVSSPATIVQNVTHHIVAVFSSFANTLYVGNNAASNSPYAGRLGYASLHYNTLTAADIAEAYNSWIGNRTFRVNDESITTVSENNLNAGSPALAYSYAWSSPSNA